MVLRLFFFNILLGLLWIILFQSSSAVDYALGFIVSFVVLSIFEPRYGRRGLYAIIFVLNVLWQVTVSSLMLAWALIQPKLEITPGIITVPLDVTHEFEIATLASAITLTPGTLSVDIGRDRQTGQQVLFVHTLFSEDPDGLRHGIKNGFERYIMEISGGETMQKGAPNGK